MLVDVIIPSLTNEKMIPILGKCIASLRASEPYHDFNLVIVESSPEKVDFGQDLTIKYDSPVFCYNHALNLGLSKTDAEWVVLANNDLIFHPNWFTEILNAHLIYPTIKSFCPWNSHRDYHNNVFHGLGNNIFVGYRVCYEICGWCLVMRREIFSKVVLDERVNLWYSDNIYADELAKHGIPHALVRDSVVDHICSQTIDFSTYDSRKDLLKYRGLE